MPIVTFLSDFGTDDVFVGVCHGVIVQRAPAASVVDLTHAVPPQDVVTGAMRLADCVGHVHAVVHLAVVDPGVGTSRRPVVVEAGEGPAYLVGPDNGLLLPAAGRLGGIRAAWEITAFPEGAASSTFHGRDVFAPAAAALAAGTTPATIGRPLAAERLTPLEVAEPVVRRGTIAAMVRDIDRFGNVQLTVDRAGLVRAGWEAARGAAEAAEPVEPGEPAVLDVASAHGRWRARRAGTFADLDDDEVGLLVDSFGWLALVVRDGSAAERLGLGRRDAVELRSPPG